MPNERGEEFRLDVDPLENYLRRAPVEIERDRSKTANVISLLLVGGGVVSLPFHLLPLWLLPSSADPIAKVFEQWNAIVSPLAGAAIGAYYASRDQRSNSR